MVAICKDVQREGHFTWKKGPEPSSPITLPTLNSFVLKSTEISATLVLKSARRMVNVALVLVLTPCMESISL